jgi:hypothetical protein
MVKSATARKAPAVKSAADAPVQPLHAPMELNDFEQPQMIVGHDDDGPMHKGMHDGHESEMHFGGEIHDDDAEKNWAPPTQLEAPEPRPNMKQRWIRMSLVGKADAKNTTSQGAQGWRPRALSSVPEGERKRYPTTKDARTGGEFMVNGDLVLCEISIRLFNQMADHYRGKATGQVNALIDSNLAASAVKGGENHGMGAPHVAERSSRVTTRRPIVAAD